MIVSEGYVDWYVKRNVDHMWIVQIVAHLTFNWRLSGAAFSNILWELMLGDWAASFHECKSLFIVY